MFGFMIIILLFGQNITSYFGADMQYAILHEPSTTVKFWQKKIHKSGKIFYIT